MALGYVKLASTGSRLGIRADGDPSAWQGRPDMAKGTAWETIRGQGVQLVEELKRLIHEGNVRRVVVRQGSRVVAEFPLTVGVVGALAAPVLAAIGALVALLADCRLDVEREMESPPSVTVRKPRTARERKRPTTKAM
jgi:hypothetical protein